MQSIPLTVAASSRTPCPYKHIPFIINKHIRIRLQRHYYAVRYYRRHIRTSIMRNRNEWLMMTRTYTPHVSGFYSGNILSPKFRKIWQGLCPYFWYFLKNAWSPLVSLIRPGLRRHIFYKKLKSQSVWPFDRTFPYDATAVCRNSANVTSNSSALCFSLRCRRRGP